MDEETFKHRLAVLGPKQERETTSLVEEYASDISQIHAAALRYAQPGAYHASRALFVIAQLRETAVQSLSVAIAAGQSNERPWLLSELLNGFAAADAAVSCRLRAALDDRRPIVPIPAMQDLEEQDPPFRVCDEAYLALRRIFNTESFLQFSVESRHFLSLPDNAKDREIASFLRTGSFTAFLADVDEEEE